MVTPGGFIARKENEAKTIDSLVTNFGECGPFQIRLVIATYSAQLCAVWGMLFMVFGNYHSEWRCLDGLSSSNSSGLDNFTISNWTLDTLLNDLAINETSNEYNQSYWNITNMSSCDIIHLCKDVGFDEKSQTIVSEWRLVCDMEWVQSLIIFLQMVGVFVGSQFGGIMGDKCGRRVNLYINVAIHTVLNLIAAFSVDWKMFACFRFFIGITGGGILSSCLLYPIEFIGKWWRGLLSVLPVWNFGAATFSLVVLLLKNWRHVHIATALLSLFVFLLGFWVPESMRWLAVHGKLERAKNVANMVAAMNNRPPPNLTPLEIFAKEERKKLRAKNPHHDQVGYLFRRQKYFALTVKMGLISGCMSLIYYTISFGMKFLTGDFYINFIIFSVAEIPGVIFVAPITRRLGSRLGSLVYFVLIFVSCLGLVIANFVAPEDSKDTIIYILALLAKSNILAAWMIIGVFSMEQYPENVTKSSTDYLNSCARIAAIISPFLIPNIVGSLYVMFIILGVYLFICCLLLVSIPAKNKELSDEDRPKSHLSIIMEETEMEVKSSECERD